MDIVEFVENVIGFKLLDFQKYYLTRLYDVYKNDPDSFNKVTCWRGSAKFDAMPLFAVIFRMFNIFSEEDEDDQNCKVRKM